MSAVASSLKGATLLILLQVGSRGLTFGLNQALLRFLSPELLGISAQLELFSISVLFFARESLRVALQRQSSSLQAVVNVAYVPLLLGLPIAWTLRYFYARTLQTGFGHVSEALTLQVVATLVELLAEPQFAVAQQQMLYAVRASAEGSATIVKCVVTFVAFLAARHYQIDAGAVPFAIGQLGYAMVLATVFIWRTLPVARQHRFSLTPRQIHEDNNDIIAGYFSRSLCSLGVFLYLQSTLKYILTQGDAILVTAMTSLREQGAYALASNYGGLLARLLFQPIEESSRNLFAKLCSTKPGEKVPPKQDLEQAVRISRVILKLYGLLAVVSWTVGPALAPLLLQVVAGSRWTGTGADEVLGFYCYLIPLLALNGVTEAFVAAVATQAELRLQSLMMGGYFAAFAAAAYVFLQILQMGARGLVAANCVNMFSRFLWNVWFMRSFFKRNGVPLSLTRALPTTTTSAVAALVLGLNLGLTPGVLNRLGPGLIAQLIERASYASLLVLGILVGERHFIRDCVGMVRSK